MKNMQKMKRAIANVPRAAAAFLAAARPDRRPGGISAFQTDARRMHQVQGENEEEQRCRQAI